MKVIRRQMNALGEQDPKSSALSATTIDLAIRLGFIGLVGYLSFRVIIPFLTIALWSAILAVALYPLFDWLAQRLSPRPAAAIVTVLCLIIVLGPVTWLGLGMIKGLHFIKATLESGQLAVPALPETVKDWPIIGDRLHQKWIFATGNTRAALAELLPVLKPVANKVLELGQDGLYFLLELLVAIVIAGFLFARGPQLVDALSAFLGRALSHRGKDLVRVAGATIRNVARGVVGISLLQALLAGMGFLVAGIPAAGLLAFVILLLGIFQIGPAFVLIPMVIWSWTAMETSHALAFTAYMIPVGLVDNVLKPLLMARGLTMPMPVIMVGVIGGTLAYGIVGLFFGPIILSVAWAVLVTWMKGDDPLAVSQREEA
jgi:predicted PurR-regulated permease PerM